MASTEDDVATEVRSLLTDRFGVPAELITPQAHIYDDLGLDSVDLLSAVAILEQRHNLVVENEDLDDVLVVGALVNHLTGLLENA